MAVRKAGELPELLGAALRARGYDVVNPADRYDLGPLAEQLQGGGSALLNPNDLRAVLAMAESPKRAAQMTPQQRLEVVQGYLEGLGTGAPMLFPVTRGRGNEMQTIAASVIDGDRLVSHALQSGGDDGTQLLFIPGANPAPITHIAERGNLADGGQIYYGTMPTAKARAVYKQAMDNGFEKAKDNALQEEFLYGSEVMNAPGPAITELYKGVSQAPQAQTPGMFNIVPSRGGQYDVLGMRQGMRTMGTARLPYEPGWLGNPYRADDVGGPYSREEATRLFGELIERKAQDPQWREAFLSLAGKNVGYYKPNEQHIHLHALQNWIAQNAGQ